MTRFQQGHIYEAFNAFHVRYYQTEIIDGQPKRVQRSHRLCAKDQKHHSRACKPVRQKCQEFMDGINAQIGTQPDRDVTVADFWEKTYLPFVTEKKRHSTVYGYKKLWASNLKQHFGTRALAEYRTADGYKYLESLTKTLGRNSLQHVRSLASGIFTRAVNLGLIDTNPWSAVRLQESRAPEPTVAYTLDETVAILKALSGRVDAALVFSLAAFLGLRPSEIAGLRWEDVTEEQIQIRQAVVRGMAGDTKTPQSQRTLPLIEPVRSLIGAYREQCAGMTEGWLFQSRAGGPVKMESFIKHAIMPAVRKAGLPWHGLYAARRACATNLVTLTGNVNAAHMVLGNSLAVAMKAYIKPSAEAGLAGLRLLEAAATNGKA
jgi:integrase